MRRVTLLLLGLVLAGCAGPPAPGIYVPTYGSMEALPAALIEGTLIEDGRCLLVESEGTRWLVLWPAGTRAVNADAGLVVREGTNEAVIGEPIRLGGGEYAMNHYAFVVDLIGEDVPPACRTSGLFWLGYFSD